MDLCRSKGVASVQGSSFTGGGTQRGVHTNVKNVFVEDGKGAEIQDARRRYFVDVDGTHEGTLNCR